MTGHDNGVITININEADDAERERMRNEMGEAYRTLLGHFRHEIGHYYWDRLIADGGRLDKFRETFGDEQRDYTEALQQHYANGPPADWQNNFVSAYASSHPWEDFAETWAHYFHMIDTLELARAFGVSVRPRLAAAAELTTTIYSGSPQRRGGADHRCLDRSLDRRQRDQPQHGAAGPVPVHPRTGRRRQADVHSRLHPRGEAAVGFSGVADGADVRHGKRSGSARGG